MEGECQRIAGQFGVFNIEVVQEDRQRSETPTFESNLKFGYPKVARNSHQYLGSFPTLLRSLAWNSCFQTACAFSKEVKASHFDQVFGRCTQCQWMRLGPGNLKEMNRKETSYNSFSKILSASKCKRYHQGYHPR